MAIQALFTVLGVLVVLLALGVPIAYSIGISSHAPILQTGPHRVSVVTRAHRLIVGMSK